MFTGIVQELGTVLSIEHLADSALLTIEAPATLAGGMDGDSIAVNGVCLTIVNHTSTAFTADVMKESLDRTSLGDLASGDKVDLEKAVTMATPLGGHLVQGHVDATVELLSRTPGKRWDVLRFQIPDHLARYVVEKGPVALDGVSLTVSAVGPGWFEVSLIPVTLAKTVLGKKTVGGRVNLEVDLFAKYIESILGNR